MHQNLQAALSPFDQAYREAHSQISQMPIDTLKKLNNTPSDVSYLIQTLPTIQSIENKRKQLIEHNRYLAMTNLKKEPELIKARTELSRSFIELAPLREAYLKNRSSNKEKSASPDVILAQLQSSAHENERLNDEMIETFFHSSHNDHDIDIFMKNFLRDRQQTIELRFFAEKFSDLYQIEKRKNE